MTYVPKLLKFLCPHYGTLKAFYDTMLDSNLKKYLADILSVLALTMSANGKRERLKYRLLGSEDDIEISQEYLMRQSEDAPVDDLMELAKQIVAFHMKYLPCFLVSNIFVRSVKNNTESEAVDLLMEVDYLDPLTEHVDITNFRRTCLYLTSVARYLMDPDDILFMNIAYSIYLMFYEFASALQIALFLDNLEHVYELFTSCDDLLMKKQFCCVLSQQDDEDRELSQNIINNVKLSEGYLTLARDFEVMEPKCLEDVYKTHLLDGRTIVGANTDSTIQNLAATFVNAFVNAGFGKDRLMTNQADSSSDDVDSRLAQIDNYLHSDDNYVIAGALLGVGLVNCSVTNDCDPALALLSEYINKEDSSIQIGAIMGLGIAYADSLNMTLLFAMLTQNIWSKPAFFFWMTSPFAMPTSLALFSCSIIPWLVSPDLLSFVCSICSYLKGTFLILNSLTAIHKHENVPLDVIAFTAISLGLVYVGSCNEEVSQAIADALTGKTEGVEATSEVSKSFSENMRNYVDITLLSCAHAETGNVLTVQKLLGHCSHLENAETSQDSAVLGIAMVAMAKEVGLEMSICSLKHLLQYGEQKIRRAVPLALGLLCISNPKVNMMDTLSRLSHDTDLEVAMATVISLGLIGARTDNASIAGMLRNLSSFYYKVLGLLFCVRIAQGLVHMGKGLLTLNPYHSDRLLCSPTALVGLVTMLHPCLDLKSIILGKYHFVLYYLVLAIKDVNDFGLLAAGEKAELATEKYVPLSPILEGYVILIENTEYMEDN
ncbi:hypothetical protein E1A91_D12G161700v1 [Gossypium mustelinum]|uniref:26S proteasome non-ATPase regulatory subunit 2 homolog n=1 Tax=Gossypium mustelinum TaxID=34275 RepID=A0A5D2SES8_GOSMU|nr:hypothetical protein E1A91_D12G161700v1 [Gossypium mustelinum]